MLIDIIAVLCGIIGLIGCILPVIPGPPISWVGLLLLYLKSGAEVSTTLLIVMLVITIVVTVLDYVVPSYFTRATGGSKAAGRGSLAGLLVGLFFFPPWGMIIGAFLGALLGEMLINGKQVEKSLKPAFGALLGFMFGTGLKLVACAVMMFYIIRNL
ncbi:MAG: DUF456 domain-containing protein [Bacteroidales bacterium]|nr:DUF456 domain-containing protein [Candidatus Cacconaster merdequi]